MKKPTWQIEETVRPRERGEKRENIFVDYIVKKVNAKYNRQPLVQAQDNK